MEWTLSQIVAIVVGLVALGLIFFFAFSKITAIGVDEQPVPQQIAPVFVVVSTWIRSKLSSI